MNSEAYGRLTEALDWAFRDDLIVEENAALERATLLNQLLSTNLSHELVSAITLHLLRQKQVRIEQSSIVTNTMTFTPWIEARRQQDDSNQARWESYLTLLRRRGRSETVLRDLGEQTDAIVERMGNPRTGGVWKRRGLVMGEVQSGKTQTYIGAINKALDFGYKVVVVIGGHTDELRRQTQARVDHDVIGEKIVSRGTNSTRKVIGVGEFGPKLTVNAFTNYDDDFGRGRGAKHSISLGGRRDVPAIFVIKKHAGIISQVAQYIASASGAERIDTPLLVIDDEADWASINTRDDNDITAVNSALRNLLAASAKSSYLAMTATPFANVLIDVADDDDLFPGDYVVSLKSPSNYHGANSYFTPDGVNRDRVIRGVEDCLELLPLKHKKDSRLEELPPTLISALESFILSVAIRRTREKQAFRSSMMINVSRFKLVQESVRTEVERYRIALQNAANSELALDLSHTSRIIASLRATFTSQYPDAGVEWSEITDHIVDALNDVEVALVNGDTTDERLKDFASLSPAQQQAFENRPRIFVGGDVLSRGLTLDGLVVSYFTRQTAAADTLLQMGRWFGYRDGYDDLVRLWVSPYVATLFERTSESLRELQDSFVFMAENGLTPRDFGLKVRAFPDTFLITALNKSLSAQKSDGLVTFFQKTLESHKLPLGREALAGNFRAVRALVSHLSQRLQLTGSRSSSRNSSNLIWRGVPVEELSVFFDDFEVHPSHPFLGSKIAPDGNHVSPFTDYLTSGTTFSHCDVAFISVSQGEHIDLGSGFTVAPNRRSGFTENLESNCLSFNNRRVASAGDLVATISDSEFTSLSIAARKREDLVMGAMTRPLIMIYTVKLDVRPGAQTSTTLSDYPSGLGPDTIISAFKVAIPPHPEGITGEVRDLKNSIGVRYLLNSVLIQNSAGVSTSDTEDDEMGEE